MNIFGTLYQYECKKLFQKKIVWISIILCVLCIILSCSVDLLGNYYIDGKIVDTNYHMYQTDKTYSLALTGRKIDQKLLDETVNAYRKIPETPGKHYSGTEEYQKYARPYSAIFNFISGTTPMQPSEIIATWNPSEEDLYIKRKVWLDSLWQDFKLTEGEKEFWTQRESQIKTPYIYQEHGAFDKLLSIFQTVGLLILLLISICLSGIFSTEHTRRMDQLILCSALGKTKLYLVKIMAGISFSIGISLIFIVFSFILTFALYGTDGFYTAFQFIYRSNSDPITCGQAILIAYGNLLAATVITSVFVMVLSELLHSSIATLAVSSGILIASMIIVVPEQHRILAQLWDWLPCCFLAPWNVFGKYTFSMFGHYFTSWQTAPVIYLGVSILITAIGQPAYRRFQVSGN